MRGESMPIIKNKEMQRSFKMFLVTAFVLSLVLFTFVPQRIQTMKIRPINPLNSTSLILYRTYLDERLSLPTIRVLAFSQCRERNVTLQLPNEVNLSLAVEPIEGSCPWAWAPSCKWSAFLLKAHFDRYRKAPNSILLISNNGGNTAEMQLHRMPSARSSGLHVCVPPLYWYSNYIAIIQFIELWKWQGTSHFYIYYQSVSRAVLHILQAYEKQGIVTLIQWRTLPKSGEIDPNRSIYRIGHSLSHNDCLHRSNARFVALVDIDELIIPNGKSLVKLLNDSLQNNSNIGSFTFGHSRLRFLRENSTDALDWQSDDFEWLLHTEFEIGNGPSKTIFLPDRTEIMLTHSVRKHFYPYTEYKVPDSIARLYHARITWASPDVAGNFTSARLFNQEQVALVKQQYSRIIAAAKKSLDPIPPVTMNVSRLVTRCLSNWRRRGCKTPYHSCRESLLNQEDWIFSDDNSSQSPYTIL